MAAALSPEGASECSLGRQPQVGVWASAPGKSVTEHQAPRGATARSAQQDLPPLSITTRQPGVECLDRMANKKERGQRANKKARPELPPGVKLLRTLEGHESVVSTVAFDPQGGTLASGSHDNTVKLWETRSGKLLRTLKGHQGAVRSVAFDPQGGTLASGSLDGTVKFWEERSGKLLRTFEGHQGPVMRVAFDPQGGTLASGSGDHTVKLWEAQSGKLLCTLEGHKDW